MPSKTIYVSEADLPLFEEAQALAGDNLSSTIMRALRNFILAEQAKNAGFEDVTVKVGKFPPYRTQQFKGRLLGKKQLPMDGGTRWHIITVYQTMKKRFAVRSKNVPNWSNWSYRTDLEWDEMGWPSPYEESKELTLEFYDTLEDLRGHIPLDLYEAIVYSLNGEDIEILDV